MVIFRENTEDIYAGIEYAGGTAESQKVLDFLAREFPKEAGKVRFGTKEKNDAWQKQLEFIGEHVGTTTPWIVERILASTRQGDDITWLTNSRLLGRAFSTLFGRKRNLLSRYPIEA